MDSGNDQALNCFIMSLFDHDKNCKDCTQKAFLKEMTATIWMAKMRNVLTFERLRLFCKPVSNHTNTLLDLLVNGSTPHLFLTMTRGSKVFFLIRQVLSQSRE